MLEEPPAPRPPAEAGGRGGGKKVALYFLSLSYLYIGQEFDPETHLYNYRMRLYDSTLRRFYAPDPKRQFASSYVYVGDDPTMMIDPTGMFSFFDFHWMG